MEWVVIEITKATNNKLYQAPQLDRAFVYIISFYDTS